MLQNIFLIFMTACWIFFNSAGQVLSEGDESSPDATQIPCICDKQYAPICGTDNNTYANLCTFDCAYQNNHPGYVDYACTGECPCICICTLEYDPVCGNDGVTYANKCEFLCEKRHFKKCLKIQHSGECDRLPIENNHDLK